MTFRIDRVVGAEAAAELVDRYRAALCEQDLLPDATALAIARQAYEDGYIYVVASRGQVWSRREFSRTDPRELRVITVSNTTVGGHTALCQEPLGLFHVVPLSELAERFVLTEWPDPAHG
ncbi:hypothetical protein [Streptomyces sp. WAC06614]|uniref:hypothetical protein n=1 Tax=Streptomyces sp. WAC06614 TaxID=2487416 RepID=UPI000F7A7170|nr:hypothetical protein [Streptomyces sp. WAC06614]RSS66129.1 hypothetical protein EF918_29725 [Streptomyces sp. WAC06614]